MRPCVRVHVCGCVCKNLKKSRTDFTTFGVVGCSPGTNQLGFDGDPNPEILKGFFIYCCDLKAKNKKHDQQSSAEVCTLVPSAF